MRKKGYKVGDLVEISWIDCQGFTNEELSKVKVAQATNVGVLISEEDNCYILRSGNYPETDDNSQEGDYTAIPKGWEQEIRVVERA